MRIRGLDRVTSEAVDRELAAGGRFVFFEYCISLIAITLRRPTDIYLLRPGQSGVPHGLPYTLISFLLGWWGLPWGFVYTPLTIVTNLSGGRDVTAEIRSMVGPGAAAAAE